MWHYIIFAQRFASVCNTYLNLMSKQARKTKDSKLLAWNVLRGNQENQFKSSYKQAMKFDGNLNVLPFLNWAVICSWIQLIVWTLISTLSFFCLIYKHPIISSYWMRFWRHWIILFSTKAKPRLITWIWDLKLPDGPFTCKSWVQNITYSKQSEWC